MKVNRLDFDSLVSVLKNDMGYESRYATRIIFVNTFENYTRLIKILTDLADEVLALSDRKFCAGADTIPDLDKVNLYLNGIADKNILIPSLGEYLRFGEVVEKSTPRVFSMIHHETFTKKRIWLPVFCAKHIFESVVGELEEERFGDAVFELAEGSSVFEATCYSSSFVDALRNLDASGLKAWIEQWDTQKVVSGMSFCSSKIKLLSASIGNYTLHVVENPFDYIVHGLSGDCVLDVNWGTTQQWAALAGYMSPAVSTIESLITTALNVITFDPYQILGSLQMAHSTVELEKWLFWLWYRLDANRGNDYISRAVSKAHTYKEIRCAIEVEIVNFIKTTDFDAYLRQREKALECMSVTDFEAGFWTQFEALPDLRAKLKVLTHNTHAERTRMIGIVSEMLESGQTTSDFRSLLEEKFPDLLFYLESTSYCADEKVSQYMRSYKRLKIANTYEMSIDNKARDCDILAYDTRSKILNAIKQKSSAYYFWIDGMGIEWIDLLLKKIAEYSSELPIPSVKIGSAIMPTITSVNMDSIDPETFNWKYDQLDSLSHIKDRSDCDYFSIVDKQFDLISEIAKIIVQIWDDNPGKDVVITADHGMSRLAAKAFHGMEGVKLPPKAEANSLGRYCIVPPDEPLYNLANTYREDNVMAFLTHHHFSCSGYAPGEIHGGATPEECLVPVIHFERPNKTSVTIPNQYNMSYMLEEHNTHLNGQGYAEFVIKTSGNVTKLTAAIKTQVVSGTLRKKGEWVVAFTGLNVDEQYELFVYLNNLDSKKSETIKVIRQGMIVDDDF